MVEVTQQKCACGDCVSVISIADAVKKDGKNYCSEACANGHKDNGSCANASCGCHGAAA